MPRFFVTSSAISIDEKGNKHIIIEGDDALHITKSLRMGAGDELDVCDMARGEYHSVISKTGSIVTLDVISERISNTEPPYNATLYQALVKGDKFDTVVQKAVECGVTRIVPVLTERCVVRLDAKSALKKAERWQRIAYEASKQCGRGIIPQVDTLLSYKDAVLEAKKADIPLLCYEGEKALTLPCALKSKPKNSSISILIGSEGGFSANEAELAVNDGMISVSLGKRILRTETASSFVLSCLAYAFEL